LEGKYFDKMGYVIFIVKWLNEEDIIDDAIVMEDGSIKFKVLYY